MDDIFNTNIDTTENKKLTNSEFVSETRKILSKIDKELQTANTWVRVTEEEFEKQDCDNCKGGCVIVRNGKELNCTPDKNDGDCFVLDFQHEQFVEEIENIMFHSPNYLFYDLLSCEVEAETSDTQKELIDLQIENKQLKEKSKELEEYLKKVIINCEKMVVEFNNRGMDMSVNGSVSMKIAYQNVLEFIKNLK